MASSDHDLMNEVRGLTGHDEATLDQEELTQVLSRAKRHIRNRRSLGSDTDWYTEPQREEALFWATCLFSKVATGELDSQDISVGAIDANTLLAKDGEQVTVWYRNMEKALRQVNPEAAFGHITTERRTYEPDDDDGGSGGVSL